MNMSIGTRYLVCDGYAYNLRVAIDFRYILLGLYGLVFYSQFYATNYSTFTADHFRVFNITLKHNLYICEMQ